MRRVPISLAAGVFVISLANASRLLIIPPPWTAALALSVIGLWTVWDARRAEGRGLLDAPAHGPLFLVCLSVYLATMRWHGGDDIPNSILPWAILRHGTFSLEPFRHRFETETLADFVVPGSRPLLSMFSVVPAVLALPVYLLPVLFGPPPNDFGLHNLSKISGALLTAASAVLVYEACRRRADGRWAAALALFYGLGTWSLSVSSQALHSHGPAQLGAALGMLGLLGTRPRDAALAGFGFALSFSSREDGVFFLAAAGLFTLLHRPRLVLPFIAGAAAPLAFVLSVWLRYTGRPLPPYLGVQSGMFTGVQWPAVWAMLASPTRGLAFFSPAALFGLWALARRPRAPEGPWPPYLLAACAALVLFISCRTSWSGGQTFGTRYFAVVCVVATVALADWRPPAAAWAAAFAVSVAVHAVGAFLPYPGSFAIERQQAELWHWGLHPLAGPAGAAALLAAVPLGVRQYRFLRRP